MRKRHTYLKDMRIVDTWHAIVSTYETGNTRHMYFAFCRTVKSHNTKILIIKQSRLGHLNTTLFC